MKKYTVEELTAILSKYVGKKMVYTDADRERILNKQSAQPYLEKIKAKIRNSYKTTTQSHHNKPNNNTIKHSYTLINHNKNKSNTNIYKRNHKHGIRYYTVIMNNNVHNKTKTYLFNINKGRNIIEDYCKKAVRTRSYSNNSNYNTNYLSNNNTDRCTNYIEAQRPRSVMKWQLKKLYLA